MFQCWKTVKNNFTTCQKFKCMKNILCTYLHNLRIYKNNFHEHIPIHKNEIKNNIKYN